MDLAPYLADVRDQLTVAAEPGGPEATAVAERLAATLESAVRLALLDALSVAAAEITQELAPGSVEVRLRGRDPEFVVVPAVVVSGSDAPGASEEPEWTGPAAGEDTAMTRINLRLGQDLKDRVEEAARRSGLSVNAWLVRSATASLTGGPSRSPRSTSGLGGDRYQGWVR